MWLGRRWACGPGNYIARIGYIIVCQVFYDKGLTGVYEVWYLIIYTKAGSFECD